MSESIRSSVISMPDCKFTLTGFSAEEKVSLHKSRTVSDQLSVVAASPVRPNFWSVAVTLREFCFLLIDALIKMLMQKLVECSTGHVPPLLLSFLK